MGVTGVSQADYRAYQLQISKNGQTVRTVIATLDHYQYPEYYPLETEETVEYIDSWMCYGRFEKFAPPCANTKITAN